MGLEEALQHEVVQHNGVGHVRTQPNGVMFVERCLEVGVVDAPHARGKGVVDLCSCWHMAPHKRQEVEELGVLRLAQRHGEVEALEPLPLQGGGDVAPVCAEPGSVLVTDVPAHGGQLRSRVCRMLLSVCVLCLVCGCRRSMQGSVPVPCHPTR